MTMTDDDLSRCRLEYQRSYGKPQDLVTWAFDWGEKLMNFADELLSRGAEAEDEEIPKDVWWDNEARIFMRLPADWDIAKKTEFTEWQEFTRKWISRRAEFPTSREAAESRMSAEPRPADATAEPVVGESFDVKQLIDDLRNMSESPYNPKDALAEKIKDEFDRLIAAQKTAAATIFSLSEHCETMKSELAAAKSRVAELEQKLLVETERAKNLLHQSAAAATYDDYLPDGRIALDVARELDLWDVPDWIRERMDSRVSRIAELEKRCEYAQSEIHRLARANESLRRTVAGMEKPAEHRTDTALRDPSEVPKSPWVWIRVNFELTGPADIPATYSEVSKLFSDNRGVQFHPRAIIGWRYAHPQPAVAATSAPRDYEERVKACVDELVHGGYRSDNETEIAKNCRVVRKHFPPENFSSGERFEGYCNMYGGNPYEGFLESKQRGPSDTPCTLFVHKPSVSVDHSSTLPDEVEP